MTSATLQAPALPVGLPDHTQLPDEDPTAVHNDHEHPQSNLLTECLLPRLGELYPDGQYCVAADVGIYFDYTNPPLDGCRAPDWFFVPGVPPMLDGKVRRSYVLWKELIRPSIVIEYVSGDGGEERDRTPRKGKFWIYERIITAGYYVIFDPWKRTLEVFAQNGDGYHEVLPNEAGRFPIKSLNVEFGIWDGVYRNLDSPWLRVWDPATGKLLPLDAERAAVAQARAEAAQARAEAAEMGLEETRSIVAEQVADLETKSKEADAAKKLAETQRRRADEQQKLRELERRRADEQQRRADEQQQVNALLLAQLREAGLVPPA